MDGQVIDGFGIVGNVFGEPWNRRYVHFYVGVTILLILMMMYLMLANILMMRMIIVMRMRMDVIVKDDTYSANIVKKTIQKP